MSARFEPPQLSRDLMAFRNRLSRHRAPWPLHWMDLAWNVTLTTSEAPRSDLYRIDIDWGGARVALGADAAWLDQASRALTGHDLAPGTASLLLQALLEATLAEISEAVERHSRKQLRIVGASPELAVASDMERFGWRMDSDERSCSGELWLDPLALGFLSAALRPFDAPPADDRATDALPVPLRFEVGWVDLAAGALAQIGGGDVVLLDECWLQAHDTLSVRAGDQAFRCVLDGTKLVVTEGWRKLMDDTLHRGHARDDAQDDDEFDEDDDLDDGEDGLDDDLDDDDLEDLDDDGGREEPGSSRKQDARRKGADGASRSASLEDIPVRLTFDLGERTVALGELRTIAPGYTFDLGRDLRRAVEIRANGKVIGSGELVTVDGCIGVSVLDIGLSDPR